MKAKPGQVSVATAGVNSSGHSAMEAIARAGRRQVQARHLRRRQSGGRRDRRRRDRRDDAAHRRAGRDDPRQAAAPARGRRRQAGRARRLRHDRAADEVAAAASRSRPNYFGIFIPKSVPPEVIATVEKIWTDQITNSAALKKYATEQRRAVRAVVRRRRGEGGDARRAGQRVAGVRRRQGEGLAGHARHRAAVTAHAGGAERRPRRALRMSRRRASPVVAARRPVRGVAWIAFGARRRHRASWRMDRLEQQGADAVHGAGLVAGHRRRSRSPLLGGVLALALGGGARARPAGTPPSADDDADVRRRSRFALAAALFFVYALLLVGRGLPFWLGTALFVIALRVRVPPRRRGCSGARRDVARRCDRWRSPAASPRASSSRSCSSSSSLVRLP